MSEYKLTALGKVVLTLLCLVIISVIVLIVVSVTAGARAGDPADSTTTGTTAATTAAPGSTPGPEQSTTGAGDTTGAQESTTGAQDTTGSGDTTGAGDTTGGDTTTGGSQGMPETGTTSGLVRPEDGSGYSSDKPGVRLLFSAESDYFRASEKKKLDEYIESIKARGNETIVIEGNAYAGHESQEFLYELSEKRAQAVAQYFIDSGISADVLWVLANGTSKQLDSSVPDYVNQTRRVDVYLLEQKQ